jgi:hypothetical protein
MTANSIVIVAAIASAFLAFGSVLAACDFYSRPGRRQPVVPEPDASIAVADGEHFKAAA